MYGVGAFETGSPGCILKTFARMSAVAIELTAAPGFMMSTRYC